MEFNNIYFVEVQCKTEYDSYQFSHSNFNMGTLIFNSVPYYKPLM